MRAILHIIPILVVPIVVSGQAFQNLDLEVLDEETDLPQEWYIVEEQGCNFKADLTHYSGHRGLLLSAEGSSSCSATILTSLSSSVFQGHDRIKIIVRVKSSTSGNGVSIVVKQLSHSGEEIKNAILAHNEKEGKVGWSELHYEQEIDSSSAYLAIGVNGQLRDSVWIDSFEVFIDGLQIEDRPPQKISKPSQNELHWLEENSIALDSFSENRRFLDAGINHANVVALGEVTHGSSEIYELKQSIVKFLVEKRGFGILAMEMDLAEAELLNNYVLNGLGDPRELLMQTSYWPWRTEEFLGMLKWMNLYNRTQDQKIMITGFDIPISTLAIDSILSFSKKYNKDLYFKMDSLQRLANRSYDRDEIDNFTARADEALVYFQQRKPHLTTLTSQSLCDRIEYKIMSLKQAAMYNYYRSIGKNYGFRDQCMAENITWLVKNNPDTKIILWAHNAHISKGSDYSAGMGKALNQTIHFFSVGFMLGNGYYNATGEFGTIKPHALNAPVSDSYEFYFAAAGRAACYLDLTDIKRENDNAWLFDIRRLRFIGSIVSRYQFAKVNLTNNFDAIVYIPKSTPSRIIVPK